MNKETMIKEMTAKVNEVMDARDAVETFLEEIEETVASGKDAVAELEAEVVAKKEALSTFTEIGEARLAKAEINNLVEDLELVTAVNAGKAKAMYAELENKAEAFMAVHKSAVFLFGAVDDVMVLNTSLSELTEAKATMTGFSNTLAGAFASVRGILLDEEIVSNENQNRLYRGYHLGQMAGDTKLAEYEHIVSPYVHKLKGMGLGIK